MTVTIENSKTPKFATHEAFAEFRLILRRDGDRIVLDVPSPTCRRAFNTFTTAEKAAYNAIVAHVVDTASAAMRKAVQI